MFLLSAEDVGCKIIVEATPLDDELYVGTAIKEFGPIEIEPSAK